MAMEEKLKQVVEELKKQAEIWNQEYDDTMIEKIERDIIKIFREHGFELLQDIDGYAKLRDPIQFIDFNAYVETDDGFEEIFVMRGMFIVRFFGIMEIIRMEDFKLFAEVEGYNADDIWHDTYLVYYKGNTVVVVREHTVYIGRGENMKFYNLVGAFKLKE